MAQQVHVKRQSAPRPKVSPVVDPVHTKARPNSIAGSEATERNLAQIMEDRMKSRFGQYDAAEQEADRLSASVVGASTPQQVKAVLGEQMGADFSDIRFHTGGDAAAKADAMGARAYATGRDVFFSNGFEPEVAAHELVHTVQQGMVSADTATISAPAGSVQMWNPFRKKNALAGTIKFEQNPKVKNLKSAGPYASVAAVTTDAGEQVIAKSGTHPEREAALAQYYNYGGDAYRKDNPFSYWSFDAPEARQLKKEEQDTFERYYGKGVKFGSDGSLIDPTAERQMAPQSFDRQDPGGMTLSDGVDLSFYDSGRRDWITAPNYRIGDNVKATTIFSRMGGKNRDEAVNHALDYPADTAVGDVRYLGDYQRVMGYAAMMDHVTGNKDRLYGFANGGNWLEETDKGGRSARIHMIDNVYESPGAFGFGGRKNWKADMADRFGAQLDETGENVVRQGSIESLYSHKIQDSDARRIGLLGTESREGSEQALRDLPGIAERIRAAAQKEERALNPSEKELLDRIDFMQKLVKSPEKLGMKQKLKKRLGLA